ncbi:SDR family NAD(P)-dependent oxidoreductase [Streptomyces roseoverticillatus]|uniref:SDR family NAD(P)-dependent oxidoreductase n=1 Tax=Streptomyces roseoverticillatus TaxID=66429 RepID=UPI0027E54487|nr:SDR family NAD(P)-dependent oxidoreductase [Streptomyces roseoverticillatus]
MRVHPEGSEDSAENDRAVAVVGAACRLPGGIGGLAALWEALEQGRDLITRVPEDRFETARFVDPSAPRPGKSRTAAGGFLEDIAGFDAGYFGISPREAAQMDPQQRLLLELTAEALDDAAIDPSALAGSDTAVFVGISDTSYGAQQMLRIEGVDAYTMAGGAASIAANRVSYAFDLRGPSMAVDTACSSALVALDRACRTLREGTSRTAVSAGVNVLLSPYPFVGFSQASMLSPRGRCAAFSAAADGYVRAEGGGVVILKLLRDALADGDRIHGVILATAVNSDGRTAGLSLPNPRAQEALLTSVYAQAGVDPDEVVYLEAHGTGTPAGDPAECEAVGRALGTRRRRGVLPVGSVKSNLGHLEPASGMAGLFKALLVLRHRRIPATLHALPLSPDIDFAGLGLAPATEARPVDGDAGRPVVGVNSFGFGGANAHAVVAAAPPPPPRARRAGARARTLPFLVSARTPEALVQAAARAAEQLAQARPDDFYDLAHTSCARRGMHPLRAAVLAGGPREAAQALARLAPRAALPLQSPAGVPAVEAVTGEAVRHGRIAFAFCGNGAQWAGMGADLLADPVFRSAVEAVDEELAPHVGWSVVKELAEASPERLRATEVAQPLLFALQTGLVAVLRAHGITPSAVLGHSVGEVAAAHAAGALGLGEAAWVIAERSRAQAPLAGCGRMAAVGMSREQAGELLAGYPGLEVAGVNSRRDVTVAGPQKQLYRLLGDLAGRGVVCAELDLDHAFHSAAMDPLRAPLHAALDGLSPSPVQVPLLSTVTGKPLEGPELDADYWWRNVREPVLFSDAVEGALEQGADIFLEIGPQPVLQSYLRRITAGHPAPGPRAVARTLRKGDDGVRAMRTAVAGLLAAGARADWDALFPRPGRVVSLPAYPWQRERHWSGGPESWVRSSGDGRTEHPLLGERMPAPLPVWHGAVEPARLPWAADHRLGGSVVMPATAYVEMALAAGRRVLDTAVEADHLEFVRPLFVPWGEPGTVHTQVSFDPEDGVVLISSTDDQTTGQSRHARGRVRARWGRPPEPADLAGARARCGRRVSGEEHYRRVGEAGLGYGPSFRVLTELWVGEGEVVAAYGDHGPLEGLELSPALLDGAVQAGAPLLDDEILAGHTYLPTAMDAVRVWRAPAAEGAVHVRERGRTATEVCWDIALTDADGTVAVELRGCRMRRLTGVRRTPVSRQETVLRAAPRPGGPQEPLPGPAPRQLAERAAGRILALRRDWRTAGYPRYAARVQEAAAHAYAAALGGLLPEGFGSFTVGDLVAGGMLPRHRQAMELMLAAMTGYGLAGQEPDGRWLRQGEPRCAIGMLREALREQPAYSTELSLLVRQFLHLGEVLRGARDPLDLLGAEGAASPLERFHDVAPVLRFHNRVAQALVQEVVAALPADRPLRVLEVGAGTGGFTAALLPLLPADRTHYLFTDVSPSLFARARQRFSPYDFVDYRTFDADADPAGQDLPAGGFDLVVAANSLHASGDLEAAVHRVASLTAPGGRLLVLESHDPLLLLPFFGTLESFWNRTDTGLRPRSPLLGREEWTALLERCGFTGTVRTGDDAEPAREDFSVLLAARADLPVRAPALPAAGIGTDWVLAAETPEENGLVGATAGLLHAADAAEVHTTVAGEDPAAWAALLSRETVIVLVLAPAGTGDVVERTTRRSAVLRALAVACGRQAGGGSVSLWLVTRPCGALPEPGSPGVDLLGPADAAAWGVAQCLGNEQAALTTRRVSLARSGDTAADADRLARELLAPSEETEVVLTRCGGRFVPRDRDFPRPLVPSSEVGAFALEVRDPGLSFRPAWVEAQRPAPGPGQVLIAVRAAALNYHDVVLATGALAGEDSADGRFEAVYGLECAGTVAAVGPDVRGFAVGERVFASGSGCLASHVVTAADAVARMPGTMGFAEAATLPAVFLTVHYGLGRQAGLSAGETVLVHGGAGGVGLAALQYARLRGAQVIATAGSPAKRDLLRALGVEHVLDSRSLAFAARVRELTGGRGVDVVLNSLAGEAVSRSLELLRPGGRFVELGKRDILENNRLLLRPFERDLAFFGVNLLALLADPQRAARLFAEVRERIRAGDYRPLPHTVFPAARAEDAFRLLQHSRHIGKVVVSFDPLDEPVLVEPRSRAPRFDPDATYLVAGGLGGYGAATAHWLADHGARRLALVGRRGVRTPGCEALLAELEQRGVHAVPHAADVADLPSMRRVVEEIDAGGHRLRGVVHCAMHLDDAPLEELTDDRFRAVLAPKAAGGAVLDALMRGREDLELFLVFSSVAARVGQVTQAPYAAGNLFLEALVRRRRRDGEPGLAVGWGVLGGTGYVARHGLAPAMESGGLEALSPREVFDAAGVLLSDGTEVAGVGRYNWARLRACLPGLAAPRYEQLVPEPDEETGRTHAEIVRALAAMPPADALRTITGQLVRILADVLHLDPARIDPGRRIEEYGVDSLMAAEFLATLHRRFDVRVPPVELMRGGGTAADIARIVHLRLSPGAGAAGPQPPTAGPAASLPEVPAQPGPAADPAEQAPPC